MWSIKKIRSRRAGGGDVGRGSPAERSFGPEAADVLGGYRIAIDVSNLLQCNATYLQWNL